MGISNDQAVNVFALLLAKGVCLTAKSRGVYVLRTTEGAHELLIGTVDECVEFAKAYNGEPLHLGDIVEHRTTRKIGYITGFARLQDGVDHGNAMRIAWSEGFKWEIPKDLRRVVGP